MTTQGQIAANEDITASNAVMPSGVVMPFAGTSAPGGWTICDGRELDIATYGALYSIVGTTYGALTNGSGAAGTTHFRVPDLRGRVPVGVGTAAGAAGATAHALGQVAGEEKHALAALEAGTQAHGHTDTLAVSNAAAIATGTESADHSHAYGGYLPTSSGGWGGRTLGDASGGYAYPTTSGSVGSDTGTSGRSVAHTHTLPAHGHTLAGGVTNHAGQAASSAHENMPPYVGLNYIIKL